MTHRKHAHDDNTDENIVTTVTPPLTPTPAPAPSKRRRLRRTETLLLSPIKQHVNSDIAATQLDNSQGPPNSHQDASATTIIATKQTSELAETLARPLPCTPTNQLGVENATKVPSKNHDVGPDPNCSVLEKKPGSPSKQPPHPTVSSNDDPVPNQPQGATGQVLTPSDKSHATSAAYKSSIQLLPPSTEQNALRDTVITEDVELNSALFLPDEDSDFRGRIQRFANYTKPAAHTFAADKLATDCRWGQKPLPHSYAKDYSKLLCMPGKRGAVNIWWVGRITSTYFMDHEKKPLRHVSINMLPLTVGTLERTRSLLGKLSKPADTDSESLDEGSWRDLKFGSWQTVFGTNKVTEFKECYDAETAFGKSDANRISAADIHYGDTVLVEGNILRYASGGVKSWETWTTRLILKSLSRLRRGPEVPSHHVAPDDSYYGEDNQADGSVSSETVQPPSPI